MINVPDGIQYSFCFVGSNTVIGRLGIYVDYAESPPRYIPDYDACMWLIARYGLSADIEVRRPKPWLSTSPDLEILIDGRVALHLTRLFEGESIYAKGTCQKCGHSGRFVRMALVCPYHGAFAGL